MVYTKGMTIPIFLTALLLAGPIAASAEAPAAEDNIGGPAGRIDISSGATSLSGSGIHEGSADSPAPGSPAPGGSASGPPSGGTLGEALKAVYGGAGGCQPPQPAAPCKIDWHWDGAQCIDGEALLVKSASSKGWTNDNWRDYFFSVIKSRGLPGEALPVSIAAIEPELVARGAGIQRNSAGEIRGRLFLPTGNINDRWSRSVDVVQGAGWCDPWGWTIR